MEVICPRCAGLDVHKQTVVACVRIAGDAAPLQEVRTFATPTSSLLELADWLESLGVEHVAMQATGVYCKPVWHVLEGHFELMPANAAHVKTVKNVPGRKTDVNDAMWLADLLAHGLIRASFVPPVAVQERTPTRTRKPTAAWHRLRDGTEWNELGAAHFDRADAAKTANRLIRRLQHIGYVVQATPA